MPTELQTTCSNLKEAETAHAAPQEHQPAPQTAPSEVSWMSLAMEKTRSLQQLFTSRFPRDFTGVQTAARPQAQVQTTNQTETVTGAQTQTSTTSLEAANQPSTDAGKAEAVQSRSQAQVVKPKTSTTSPVRSNTSREAHTSKQTNEPQSHPNTTQSAAQSASVQTHPRTTQSPLHSSVQTETSSQFAQGTVTHSLAQFYLSSGQQQPPWSNRGLQPANKSTTSAPSTVSTTSSATASPPVSALGRGEREATVQEKEGASLSGRRAVWTGSVIEKAAFLEKQAEGTTPPGTKGVCGISL